MTSTLEKIINIPRTGFRYAVNLFSFPRKFRHQNHRISMLEDRIGELDILTSHLPTILNYITSFSYTSRELTRHNQEVHRLLDETVTRLWERVEFVRNEILYEIMYREHGKVTEEPKTVQKIINEEKLSSMGEKIRVNMGCGHVISDDYINVDKRELPGVDLVADVTAMPFEKFSLQELFSSHLIEHFTQEELRRYILPYWFSLLKPGGVFHAVLPDWEAMITGFAEGSFPFENLREVTFGSQEYDGDFHFNMFSQETLRTTLEAAGFREVSFPVTNRINGKCREMEVMAVK